MQTKTKVILLVLAVATPAFVLGAGTPVGKIMWGAIWPFQAGEEMALEAWQVPLFMGMGLLEALSLGAAVAFLVYGAPLARRIAPGMRPGLFVAAVAWVLGNWWFHDSIHITNGMSATGLIIIEYAFHATLMASGGVLAWGLVQSARAAPQAKAKASPQAPRVRA